jgi:DNA invertase Pin-like site-specific DNA recombinase
MLIGYTRLSTGVQNTQFQFDPLMSAGSERLFSEQASGAAFGLPVLTDAISLLRRGDTLVVWRLNRLGRSLPHLIEVVPRLEDDRVGLRSLTEGIDTTTPNEDLVFPRFGALAQFKRELIRKRTQAGFAAATALGRKGVRPPKQD